MDAFDADALIYAAAPGHELGRRVLALFPSEPPETTGSAAGIGSVYLMPEVLIRPVRNQDLDESVALGALLARLDLRPADDATGRLAVILGAKYGLLAGDAIHLATAVQAGARRFITNNSRDFPKSITEISITYPADLPDPTAQEGAEKPRAKGFAG